MFNPFSDTTEEISDEKLVSKAQEGSSDALEQLLLRHRPWILNIAIRMLLMPADAEDATQDILIKVLHGLHAFRGESKFRTWLYRIAVNQILNFRRKSWSSSNAVCSFTDASMGLKVTPDLDLPDPSSVPVPVAILVEEAKIGCSMGMLLCLDGRQRLVFILGEIFGVNDTVGAEIANVTPDNFRQILCRTRQDLYAFLRGECGLIDPKNSCHCARKTSNYIQRGFVDPNNLKFTSDYRRKVRDVAQNRMNELHEAYMQVCANVYIDHPFYDPPSQLEKVRKALESVSLDPPD
jgi:RNA polymerase sigma factor (sigma-70 family)